MNNKLTHILSLGLIAVAIIAGTVAYPHLPTEIASHWNVNGEVDGYMSKFWGVFLIPIIMVFVYGMYMAIPKIDPLRADISLKRHYNVFWVFLLGFFAYIFALSLAWNFGYRFNFVVALAPAISVLLYTIGSMTEHSKRNWLIGIRTPWTLSSDTVWEKTHRLGGILFKWAALIPLLVFIYSDTSATLFLILPIIFISLFLIVYSFVIYRKL